MQYVKNAGFRWTIRCPKTGFFCVEIRKESIFEHEGYLKRNKTTNKGQEN